MKVLVTGDRDWVNYFIMETVLAGLTMVSIERTTIIHGAARGADRMAGKIADRVNLNVIEYPAEWDKHGRAAGPIRNRAMLDNEKPDLVLAFHNDLENSKGTKDMVQYARKKKVPVYHIREVL